jgi:hypothetical protein
MDRSLDEILAERQSVRDSSHASSLHHIFCKHPRLTSTWRRRTEEVVAIATKTAAAIGDAASDRNTPATA